MPALDYTNLLDAGGKVRDDRVDDLMVEVVSGRYLFSVGATTYASRVPSPEESDTARLIYVRSLRECIAGGVMSRQQLEETAIKTGDLSPRVQAEKIGIEKYIKQLNETRSRTPNEIQRKSLAVQIEQASEKLGKLIVQIETVLQRSAEGCAEEARSIFLTFCCTGGGVLLDQPVWPTWDAFMGDSNLNLLAAAREAQARVHVGLPHSVVRSMARHPEWRQRWRAAKEAGTPVFNGAPASWDRNKVQLVMWSDFFDSVLANPECPGEAMIHNDVALEAWIQGQVAKSKKDRQAASSNTSSSGNTKRIEVKQNYRLRSQEPAVAEAVPA